MRETRGKKRGHLVTKVLLVAVSLATIIGVALIVLGITEIDSAYEGMAKKMLRASEYQMQEMFNDIYDGDWAYDEEAGGVTKGGTPVYDEYLRDMEDMSKETEINYTLFWGKTRVITTIKDKAGNYMVGTDAGEAVIDAVLNKGEQFYTTTAVIDGIPYYGYYGPVKNSDGSIVGMAFSGMPKSEVTATITRATLIMIGVGVFLLAILIIVGVFLARSSAKAMSLITAGISTVAGGDLTHDMPGELLKRNDELGEISSNVSELIEKLREVIGTSKKLSQDVSQSGDELSESATQASAASNQVTEAVDDISKGAVGQAESVQDSAQNVNEIGGDIDTISGNVETLSGNTQDMKTACANSMAALENLLSQNSGVVNSMGVIDQQIRNTNDAVINISEATKLITDIASQTNLLALNASIEAARAGEAGKGFAVVATEIGGLAEQSRQATVEINDIVKQLIEESQKSVETIELLNQEFEEQSRQIEATKADMERMEVGVNSVADSAGEISGRVVNLDSSKGNLVSIIEDLSAVSQENAAATEETTASMEELNATFELISRSAEDLKVLASQLDEQISFFTI